MNDLAFANITPPDPELTTEEEIAKKIIHLLKVYPIISPSMLQIGIGSGISAKMWRPVFHGLLHDKVVKQDDYVHLSASGRQQVYSLISLYETPVTNPAD